MSVTTYNNTICSSTVTTLQFYGCSLLAQTGASIPVTRIGSTALSAQPVVACARHSHEPGC
eukprot:3153494-Amphidinium_carterae.1